MNTDINKYVSEEKADIIDKIMISETSEDNNFATFEDVKKELEEFDNMEISSNEIRLKVPKTLYKALLLDAEEQGVDLDKYLIYRLAIG